MCSSSGLVVVVAVVMIPQPRPSRFCSNRAPDGTKVAVVVRGGMMTVVLVVVKKIVVVTVTIAMMRMRQLER